MSHTIYGFFVRFMSFPTTKSSTLCYNTWYRYRYWYCFYLFDSLLLASLLLFTRVQHFFFLFMRHISTKLWQYFSSHFHGSYRFYIGIGNGKHKMFHTHKLLDESTRLYLFIVICILDSFFFVVAILLNNRVDKVAEFKSKLLCTQPNQAITTKKLKQ